MRTSLGATLLALTMHAFSQADDQTPFKIQTRKRADAVTVRGDDRQTIFTVQSPSGIGNASIERIGDAWPKTVVLHLRLQGLENFKATLGGQTLHAAVASTETPPTIRLWKNNDEAAPLKKGDPFWTPIQILKRDGAPATALPLSDGTFEIPLPPALFGGNPKTLELSWIDFYRN
jgi:hypothetical protein